MSAHQMHRMLKITYKAAWFMCHRIRFGFGDDAKTKPLSGTVEVDETFVGGVGDRRTSFLRKIPVVVLLERGGKARTRVVANVSQRNLGQCLFECVDKSATVNTDDHDAYKPALKKYARHDVVNHTREEYHRVNPDGTISTSQSDKKATAMPPVAAMNPPISAGAIFSMNWHNGLCCFLQL
jgi:hypothetical protein